MLVRTKDENQVYDQQSRNIPLKDINSRECRWPVNDPPKGGEFLFCGLPVAPLSRYCDHHKRRSIVQIHSEETS